MQSQQPALSTNPHAVAPISVALLGGTFASVLWALAWVAVALVAIDHAVQSFTGEAFLGVIVSIPVSAIGCKVALLGLRSSHRCADAPSEPESIGRRIVGWFAAFVWCGAGVVWNLSIFGLLFKAAAKGQGVAIAVMVLFSLIGWFLLHLVFIGLGCIVDWALGLIGYRGPVSRQDG
jgi:hypothetical protein